MGERLRLKGKAPDTKRENSISNIRHARFSRTLNRSVDGILYLQRTIGNQAVQRLFKSGVFQGKLKIGQHGDKYEQEVHSEAETVGEKSFRLSPPTMAIEAPVNDKVQRSSAWTVDGRTTMDWRVSLSPRRAEIEAHEAIHRAQYASRGLVPYGDEAELEAEARLGAKDLLAGRTTVKTSYAAAPGQRLNYETERESEAPEEHQQSFPEKTNVAIDVTVRWHEDRFSFREEIVKKILDSQKLRAQARKVGVTVSELESAIDTNLALHELAGKGPSLSGYKEGDKVRLLVVVTLTPYPTATFPILDIAVLQPRVQIGPPRFPRIERLEALEKALMEDCIALMDQIAQRNKVLEAELARMETGAWLATFGGIAVVPHPAFVLLGILADLIILYSTGDERMDRTEAMFALGKPAVELSGEAGLTGGELAARGEKVTLLRILKSMVTGKQIPPGAASGIPASAKVLGIAAKAFGPLVSSVVWIYKIEHFFDISREVNDQLNESLSVSWRLEAKIRLIEEARRERERLEALRR
jgi:hypothetical protein